ncbi:nicotinate dehydrogenase subunit A [Catalinimonas alkaloidigena]|uniref:Nicotinate dehydrogenase subunit A n=1 Tax=Catalinimonas alkaloidigena TaxID=1075417 RepID=A0A1G9SA14_9BACT|nr:(2Fe-2S)-binding protein [Catalinimonas alkaloidigena]SDM31625.1 nicotinate dehydrogenase subunit A [Catalinimonas alkaloidigena]
MPQRIQLQVNGQRHEAELEPEMPLLYFLRNELQLNGPKYGCGLQQCGSCMVLLDGKAQPSCVLPVVAAQQHSITTLEGLGTAERMNRVQRAFVEEQAAQCGYCLNGMIISAQALLDATPSPSEEEIKTALARVLCRCGTHTRMMRAVQRAARHLQ